MTEKDNATGGQSPDATTRNRRMLMAMFAIAFLTLGGSYVLFYSAREGGVWGLEEFLEVKAVSGWAAE